MNLLDKLNLLKGSLCKQDFVPILTNFCFTGTEIIAFDGVQASVIGYDSDLKCGLPAQLLSKLLVGYKKFDIKMIVEDDNVVIKQGKSKVKLSSLSATDFVFELPDSIQGIKHKFDNDFIEGIQKCLVSVLEGSRQAGITIINDSKKTMLYGTNNHSISSYKLKKSFDVEEFKSFLPLEFCNQLILWHSKFSDSKLKEILFSDDYVMVDFDEGYLYTQISKTIQYLDYEELIEEMFEDESDEFEVPEELDSVLDRCILIVESENDSRVAIEIKDNSMSFNAKGRYGDSQDTVILECEVVDCRFVVDPVLFKKMLVLVEDLSISNDGDFKVIIGRNKNYTILLRSLKG